jgi:hypothetical protein
MHPRSRVVAQTLLAVFITTMVAATPAEGQALSLLRTLRGLGVSPAQAIGGSKAILGIARRNLAPAEFSQLVGSVPQFSEVLDMTDDDGVAGAIGGIRRGRDDSGDAQDDSAEAIAPVELSADAIDALTSDPGLVEEFADLGMDASMIGKFAPTLLGAAGRAGGPSSVQLLRKGLGIL